MRIIKITGFVQRNGYALLGLAFSMVLAVQLAAELAPLGEVDQPDDVAAETRDITAAFQRRDFVQAKELARDYMEKNPEVAEGYFLLAQSELQVGNLLAAVELTLQAAQLDPAKVDYHVFLSDVYSLIGWRGKAEEQITLAVELEPEDLGLLLKRHELLLLLGRPYEALEDLNYGISVSEGDLDLILRRADLHWRLNDTESAKQDLVYVMASGNKEKAGIAREMRRRIDQP